MTNELRDRLDAMTTDELLQILEQRDVEEWREEVFPLIEEVLRARGIEPLEAARRPNSADSSPAVVFTSVATFSTALEANLCKMALAESGIEAWLPTEHLAGVAPPLGVAFGVDVLVRDEDAAAAREVLQELAVGGASLPEEPEPCPRCGSSETKHVHEPDRIGAVAGWALVGMPLPAIKWRWVCESCQNEWR